MNPHYDPSCLDKGLLPLLISSSLQFFSVGVPLPLSNYTLTVSALRVSISNQRVFNIIFFSALSTKFLTVI